MNAYAVAADGSHMMTELCTIDLLISDDFALEPMTRDKSREVYQLFVERTGKAATIITSNRDTSDWLAVIEAPFSVRAPRSVQEQRLRPRRRPRVVPARSTYEHRFLLGQPRSRRLRHAVSSG